MTLTAGTTKGRPRPSLSRLASTMRRDESGLAMVMVIAVGSVVAILLVTAIAVSMGSVRAARNEESWSGALAAAYAGVEEYQSRLSDDPTYLKYGDHAATFSSTSVLTAPPAASPNPAFGLGTAGTWATVAGSNGTASFRYEVDNSSYASEGTLSIRSTGRVGTETRTVVADLRQTGFIDFLYFTDYEIQDTDLSHANVADCVRYDWAGRDQSDHCSEIAFGEDDTLDGPVHSNDTIRACESTFRKAVTSADSASTLHYLRQNSLGTACAASTFDLAGYPAYSPVIGMPATNSQLKRETRSDLTTVDVPNPGCLYTGPTDIQFNASGTVTVRSPWTIKTQTVGDPATSGSSPVACGTPGVTGLGSAAGSTFTVPANNVMYVQTVPAVASDPNYWASSAAPQTSYPSGTASTLQCKGLGGQSNGNGIGYPMVNEDGPESSYGCRTGDAFVEGVLKGAVTVAAEKYIYVTGDQTYAAGANNMLGLVGNNAIFVWNPVHNTNDSLLPANREIYAAILSVAHTFQVQNYDDGQNQGTLSVHGAIAQKFRGIVRQTPTSSGHGSSGGGITGYAKNYIYDARFKYTAPPKYLSPVTTTYGVTQWIEVQRAFDSKGTQL